VISWIAFLNFSDLLFSWDSIMMVEYCDKFTRFVVSITIIH
jgi:hypothetical protein